MNGLGHVHYEGAHHCSRLFSVVCRRIRCNPTCVFEIAHGHLGLLWDEVFSAPTRSGFHVHAFKINQLRV